MKIRGVWLTNVDSRVLDSRASIFEAMEFLASIGINCVFPVVWNKGFTLYPSRVMGEAFGSDFELDSRYQRQGRDPLWELVEAAHSFGLMVIPWFEYGFAYSHVSLNHPLKHRLQERLQHLGWLAYDRHGNILQKNGFQWLNALLPEVQDFMFNLILEVIRNCNVDGIQGCDRLPAFPCEGGFDLVTKQRFYQQFGKEPPYHYVKHKLWLQWRADLLTDFLTRVYGEVKAINPRLLVSMAPHPFDFGKYEYLQDCLRWLELGVVDLIHPQLYRRDFRSCRTLLDTTVKQLSRQDLSKLFPGVLLNISNFIISESMLQKIIKYHRQLGIQGEVFFFYEGLRYNNNQLAQCLTLRNGS